LDETLASNVYANISMAWDANVSEIARDSLQRMGYRSILMQRKE